MIHVSSDAQKSKLIDIANRLLSQFFFRENITNLRKNLEEILKAHKAHYQWLDDTEKFLNSEFKCEVSDFFNSINDVVDTIFVEEKFSLFITLTELALDKYLNEKIHELLMNSKLYINGGLSEEEVYELSNLKKGLTNVVNRICGEHISGKIAGILENPIELFSRENIKKILGLLSVEIDDTEAQAVHDVISTFISDNLATQGGKLNVILKLFADHNFIKEVIELASKLLINVDDKEISSISKISNIIVNYVEKSKLESELKFLGDEDRLKKVINVARKALTEDILRKDLIIDISNIIQAIKGNQGSLGSTQILPIQGLTNHQDITTEQTDDDSSKQKLLLDQGLVIRVLKLIYTMLDINQEGIEEKAALIAKILEISLQKIEEGEQEQKIEAESEGSIKDSEENKKKNISPRKALFIKLFCDKDNFEIFLSIILDCINVKVIEEQKDFLGDLYSEGQDNGLKYLIHQLLRDRNFQKFLPAVTIAPIEYLITHQVSIKNQNEQRDLVKKLKQTMKEIRKTFACLDESGEFCERKLNQLKKLIEVRVLSNPLNTKHNKVDLQSFLKFLMHSDNSLRKLLSEIFIDNDVEFDGKNLKDQIIDYHKDISRLFGFNVEQILHILSQEILEKDDVKELKGIIRTIIQDLFSIHNSSFTGKLITFGGFVVFRKVSDVVTKKMPTEISNKNDDSFSSDISDLKLDEFINKIFVGDFIQVLTGISGIRDYDNSAQLKDKFLKIVTYETSDNDRNLVQVAESHMSDSLDDSSNENLNISTRRNRSKSDSALDWSQHPSERLPILVQYTNDNNIQRDLTFVSEKQKPKTVINITTKKTAIKPYIAIFLLLSSSVVMFVIEHFKHNSILLYTSLIFAVVSMFSVTVKEIVDYCTQRKNTVENIGIQSSKLHKM